MRKTIHTTRPQRIRWSRVRYSQPRIEIRWAREESYALHYRRVRRYHRRHPTVKPYVLVRILFASVQDYVRMAGWAARTGRGPLLSCPDPTTRPPLPPRQWSGVCVGRL